MAKSLLKLKNVSKFYYSKGIVASGMIKVNLEFNLGEFVVITGESGSGKSTLLNVLSGLDTYEEGEMYINGLETSHYGDADFEEYRKTYIGNIFQSFNLVNSYTVYQNIELVLLLNGYKKKDVKDKIIDLIKKVDLYKYRNTRVSKLSGGQKQRVAIARALAKDTPIIIADEPTGNLDTKSANSVIKLLSEIAKDKLVVVVTHNYEQVEKYATRKIEMHDGKVREDILLKETDEKEANVYDYKDVKFFNKLRLGIRNAFNIIPKFLLTFVVFLFVILAFLSTYSSFRRGEYETSKEGYNDYFSNLDEGRIVVKKKDNSIISSDDISKLSNIDNVKRVEKDDLLLDTPFDLEGDMVYLYGTIDNVNRVTKVDDGRLPKNENEIVIQGSKWNWYYNDGKEETYNESFNLGNGGFKVDLDNKLKVVGIIYDDYRERIYVSDKVIDNIRIFANQRHSNVKLVVNNNVFKIENGWGEFRIAPNKLVSEGEVTVPSDLNNYCKYEWCRNQNLHLELKSIYYEDTLDLTMSGIYFNYNFKAVTGLEDYELHNGTIFMSEKDFARLFEKETYQVSVFAKDDKKVDDLKKDIKALGFKPLAMKDVRVNDAEIMIKVIQILKLIVIIILFIVMFFIAYFVIKLIQKSKNVYYSTVRILGGSKKVIKNLISIELLIMFNLAYILSMALVILVKKGILNIKFISNLTEFLNVYDYIIIYIILFIMSYFISLRYSRKLFKSSAMKAYNEEV